MHIYKSPICSCIICGKQLSAKGIAGHHRLSHDAAQRVAHQQRMKFVAPQISSKLKQNTINQFKETADKFCKSCTLALPFEKRHSTFCSKSCSTTFTNTKRKVKESTKKKLSLYAKNNPSGFVTNRPTFQRKGTYKTCSSETCQNKFYAYPCEESKKYCSFSCFIPYSGGERKGSGNSKGGYYKGFYLASTYELCYYIFCVDHQICIERNKESWKYYYNGKHRKYYPDFRVNGRLVEIKGYYTHVVDLKLQSVSEPIDILYKKDLKFVFDYVTDFYFVTDYKVLYD